MFNFTTASNPEFLVFYKIRNDVLFRRYDHHGYIADNSEYGYRFLDDTSSRPGETFVSESGAVMLSTLSNSPRDIESIVDDLMRIFRGVGRDDLKLDVVEFFHSLVEKGYLSEGGTASTCVDPDLPPASALHTGEGAPPIVPIEDCAGGLDGAQRLLQEYSFRCRGRMQRTLRPLLHSGRMQEKDD